MNQRYDKEKGLKREQKILLTVSTLILSLLILFTTYYFIQKKEDSNYINSLYKQKIIIDSVNKEVSQALKDIDQLDVNDTSKLNDIISNLLKSESTFQKIITSLNEIKPLPKYKAQFDNLLQGVTLNKKIYTQTLLILKNTKSNNLKKATSDLEEYIKQSYQHYETSKLDKVYIVLPSDILALSDKVYQYASRAYSDFEAKSRLLEQYTNYFSSMDKIISDYQNIKTNLSKELQDIRNGKATLESVYIKIEDKLSSLDSISKSYNSLSVPVKVAQQHQKFNIFLTEYSNYCLDFKSNLYKLEEAGSDQLKLMEVNAQFDNLNNQFNSINDSFFSYMDKYNEMKSILTDFNNL